MSATTPLTRRRETWIATAFTLCLAIPLAVGFVPSAQELWNAIATRAKFLPAGPWAPSFGFLFLAGLFFVSVRPRPAARSTGLRELVVTIPVPVLIALAYGALHRGPSLLHAGLATVTWYLVAIPLGEEMLFRGWLYAILLRLGGDRRLTLTAPFPLAVWLTSAAFSLWHLQNWGKDPAPLVLFQCLYTFFTGLWLGWLRWKGGNIALPTLAHGLLNAAAAVF